MLIIFSGLPGAGKTTLAREVARRLAAVYVRADTIEQALREGGLDDIGGLGYGVGYRLATENLSLGRNVVADSVNPWPLTREAWRQAARNAGKPFFDVEVLCGDQVEHRRRVETRTVDVEGLVAPTWEEVVQRDYRPWDEPPFRVDTATLSIEEAVREILANLPKLD